MATPLSSSIRTFRTNTLIRSRLLSIESIPISSSLDIQISGMTNGIIRGLRIYNNSLDYNISLRIGSTAPPSIKELLKAINIEKVYSEILLFLPYVTVSEANDSLYLLVTNNDSVNATGVFSVEIIYSTVTVYS